MRAAANTVELVKKFNFKLAVAAFKKVDSVDTHSAKNKGKTADSDTANNSICFNNLNSCLPSTLTPRPSANVPLL